MTTERIEVAYDGDAPVPPVEPVDGSHDPSRPGLESDATHDAPGAEPIIPIEIVQAVVSAGFDSLASRRGDHWRVTPDEAHNIAEPLAGELDELAQYAPFLGGAAAALGSRRMRLLAALTITITPRLVVDVMTSHEDAREETRAKVTPIRPAQNDTPARSSDLIQGDATRDGDELGDRFAGLPPRDGGA